MQATKGMATVYAPQGAFASSHTMCSFYYWERHTTIQKPFVNLLLLSCMPIPSSSISYFVSLNYTKFSVVEDIPENAQLSALTITRLSNCHSLE
jgi:hypothetical protein